MKKIILILIALMSLATQAAIIPLRDTYARHESSATNSLENIDSSFSQTFNEDSTALTFHLQIPAVEVTADSTLYKGTYFWDARGFFPPLNQGSAYLPQRIIVFSLPLSAQCITLSENHSKWCSISNYPPTPARPPRQFSENTDYSLNDVVPISEQYMPPQAAKILKIEEDQNQILVYVHLTPFCLNSDRINVSACYDFSYTLSFAHKENNAAPSKIKSVGETTIGTKHLCELYRTAADYLIVTTTPFEPVIKEYAEWKKTFGHKVSIISKTSWEPEEIRNSIISAYSDNNNLNYVIFAGPYDDIPAMLSPTYRFYDKDLFPEGEMRTDFYYSCVDNENDTIPNLYTGRFIADTPDEMQEIIAKAKRFYTTGVNVPGFYDNATHVSRFQAGNGSDYTSWPFISTSEEIRNHVIANGKNVNRIYDADKGTKPMYIHDGSSKTLLPEDLQYGNFSWVGTTQDVVDSFNNGNFYILYNAHGAYSGWGQPSFGYFDFNMLKNNEALPIVFSMSCNTGNFVTDDGFARHLLTCTNGGARAVIAAERPSYVPYNDQIAIGIFQTIWPTPKFSTNRVDMNIPFIIGFPLKNPDGTYGLYPEYKMALGNLLHIGKRYMYRVSKPSYNYIRWHNEMYHIFGDPGAFIHTQTPSEFSNIAYSINKEDSANGRWVVSVSTDENVMIGFYNETTGISECFRTNNVTRDISPTDNYHFKLWTINKVPYSIDVVDGRTSFSGPVILKSAPHQSATISNIRQMADNLYVDTDITPIETTTSTYSLELRDLNNNLLDCQEVEYGKEISPLSTTKSKPGIHVIRLCENGNMIDYKKIIIK